ncbi:MAG TPA: glycerol-3-phosphate dehydrogenase C-terminal domain-containing protein, partial [Burkholderiaceae bacterium]|nr:glycerol-3-phosphate dehydrogenase C-terminal domain-containing protein [Burkholderiaceae bacterium]
YRAMAEDVLTQCFDANLLPRRPADVTKNFKLLGAQSFDASSTKLSNMSIAQGLHSYGDEAALVSKLPGHKTVLHDGLTEAMVRFAARYEYARTVEDMLARRWRTLFLDAKLAASLTEPVAQILQEETGQDPQLAAFLDLAKQYQTLP